MFPSGLTVCSGDPDLTLLGSVLSGYHLLPAQP